MSEDIKEQVMGGARKLEEIKEEYEAVLKAAMRERLNDETRAKLDGLIAQFQRQLLEVETLLDPFQYKYRERIAKDKRYDYIGVFNSGGVARAKYGHRWFLISRDGNRVNDKLYTHVSPYKEEIAKILTKGGYTYVNSKGEEITDRKFNNARDFSGNIAVVGFVNTKSGYIDKNTNMLFDGREFDSAWDFSEGLAVVRLSGECFYIDEFGNRVLGTSYRFASPFSEGLALVSIKLGEYFFIDKAGNKVLPKDPSSYYLSGRSFSEGLAAVMDELSGRRFQWRFIDEEGTAKIILNLGRSFDNATQFSEGLSWVIQGDGYRCIDKNGNRAFVAQYSGVNDFRNGVAVVQQDGRFAIINKKGEVIAGFYDQIHGVEEGAFLVHKAHYKVAYYINIRGQRMFS